MVSRKKKVRVTGVPRRRSRPHAGPGATRACPSCDARLASDKKGRLCSPCERSGRGLRDDQEVFDFALGLYPLRQKLGSLGLDYIFFHQFFNRALQDELTELRQALYHQPGPPRPLSLGDAAIWAVQMETRDDLPANLTSVVRRIEGLTETSPEKGTATLLLHASDEPRWPGSLRLHAGAVSQRLRELENELPAAFGTLQLALVCGTPPIPPGIRTSSELRLVPLVGWVQPFSLKVFSAKERDIKPAYEEMLGGRFSYIKRDFFPIGKRWQPGRPLPFLEIVCVPYRGSVPTPAAVQRVFKAARTPVSRFFDGAVKARDYGYTLRAWAMLVLIEKRKMSHRDALSFWNERAPRSLSFRFDATVRKTQTGESVLAQEIRRLRQRLKRWQSA